MGGDVSLYTTAYFIPVFTDNTIGSDPSDGSIGFGFSSQSSGYATFVDSLYQAGVIKSRIFGIYLNRIGNNRDEAGYGKHSSIIEIGSYNFTKYTDTSFPEITILNVEKAESWTVNELFSLNTNGFGHFVEKRLVFDSGAALIYLDEETFSMVYDNILTTYIDCELNENKMIVCKCISVGYMTPMIFTFRRGKIVVSNERLWMKGSKSGTCLMLVTTSQDDTCILGDVFLQDYYIVYDMDNLTISAAKSYFYDGRNLLTGTLMITVLFIFIS